MLFSGRGCGEEDPRRRDSQEPERACQPGVPRTLQEHSGDAQVVEDEDIYFAKRTLLYYTFRDC